jgi:hypothetical protein
MVRDPLYTKYFMMKTTTQIVDDEYEYLREKGYLDAERYEMETRLMWELFEEEKLVRVILGKGRKKRKTDKHATVTRKLPRIISFQLNNRRIQPASV